MPLVDLPPLAILLANVVAWGLGHGVSGYVAHRLPASRLAADGPLLRLRRFEAEGRGYERLRIRRWKDRLPEAGALFAGGVAKRSLPAPGRAGLAAFAVETRRAERGHWLSLLVLPLFPLWNPPLGVVLLTAYGVLVNLPFIAVQRYNRARIARITSIRDRRRPVSPTPRAAA